MVNGCIITLIADNIDQIKEKDNQFKKKGDSAFPSFVTRVKQSKVLVVPGTLSRVLCAVWILKNHRIK